MTVAIPSDEALTHLADTLGERLQAAGLTCATAESCTGGLVGHWITEVAGCSAYFAGGAITYSNEAKQSLLGVDAAMLATEGAVSASAAAQVAAAARADDG